MIYKASPLTIVYRLIGMLSFSTGMEQYLGRIERLFGFLVPLLGRIERLSGILVQLLGRIERLLGILVQL